VTVADTNIEWATKVWNPIRGCSRVSAGCGTGREGGCYAERQAIRHAGPGGAYEGLVRIGKHGPSWTGEVRLIEEKLYEPIGWKKSERIFVNSMSDLFHEKLGWERHIERVWNKMAVVDRHDYLVLTKRAQNMRDFVGDWYRRSMSKVLPQIWLGVSVEDHATADERIPLLLQTPAAVRFVSYEPALGPVDFTRWLRRMVVGPADELTDRMVESGWSHPGGCGDHPALNWVIVGGESGPRARPFDVEWARSTIWQCREASVPVFVKQLGARPFYSHQPRRGFEATPLKLEDRKGGDMEEWWEDIRVREFPYARAVQVRRG
jgi:protein gp37